jgi:GT2 family glycosyltransferase
MICSLVMPTQNRPGRLERSLHALAELPIERFSEAGGIELVIADDASELPVAAPSRLANGLPVTVVRLDEPAGAAARNRGAEVARGEWVMMLDDDSWPLDDAAVNVMLDAAHEPALFAVGAQILTPIGTRERGGLPEVIVGCGMLVRRDRFLELGGYDPSLHYYAEEYDLSARAIAAGYIIGHDFRWRVRHERAMHGRDLNAILQRLVRNSAWVAHRYAPEPVREAAIAEIVNRYREIARKENAIAGFERGFTEFRIGLFDQPRAPMTDEQWDRYTGRAAVRDHFASVPALDGARVALVDPDKHPALVKEELRRRGARLVEAADHPDHVVIGTIAPGPMMDAVEARLRDGQPALAPWRPRHTGLCPAATDGAPR